MLPQLRQLDQRYPRQLRIIGVHAGKYPNERREAQLRAALARLEVDHPVLSDRKFRMWRAYGVFGWPTLVLLDPRGRVVHTRVGESTADYWIPLLDRLIMAATAHGSLQTMPVPERRPPRDPAPHGLRFPEKPLMLDDGRLAVADTGNHRLLLGVLDGARFVVTKIIGSGRAGTSDGPAATTQFQQPRGLAQVGTTLYIADTGNHRIRAYALDRDVVSTVAGTGARAVLPLQGGPGPATPLASPWDLTPLGGQLIIAMAGLHQLWRYDPETATVGPLAGSGAEDLLDGPLREAALAQPTGITSSGDAVFWADAESQAIRRATIGPTGTTTTLIGTGLFDFADRDGVGAEVLLQHPQAIVAHNGLLYIADTYNHKIKVLDPETRACRTWLGRRRIAGHVDGSGDAAAFDTPSGLAIAGERLLIADTNNHCIRVAELGTGDVCTLQVAGLNREEHA